MAWTTGTCTGHLELLDALKTYLTANGWACLADRMETIDDTSSYAPSSLDHRTLYFKGSGLAGEDEIYIGFQDWQWANTDICNIAIQGFTGFDVNLTFWGQPGAIERYQSYADYINLNLSSSSVEIVYWFIVNGRRVIIITRNSSVYCCAYLGFFLPYCLPSQYPYPMFIGGNSNRLNLRYSQQDSGNCNFWWASGRYDSRYTGNPSYDRYSTAAYLNGTWSRIHYYELTSAFPSGISYSMFLNTSLAFPSSSHRLFSCVKNDDESRILMPVTIVNSDGSQGVLDGVYNVDALNANAEDTITMNSKTYLLVPNVYRPSSSQFAAIEMG